MSNLQPSPYWPLLRDAFLRSYWLAGIQLLLTFAPILGGLVSWLLGSPSWVVFLVMLPSPLIAGAAAFSSAREVWQKEAARVVELERQLQGRPFVKLIPSTDSQWAYLEVRNIGPNEAEFEVKMKRIASQESPKVILPYRIRWRDQIAAARTIKAGNSALLNVAEINIPDLLTSDTNDLLERALSDKVDLRFYSADVPDGHDPFFLYEASADSDVQCYMEVFASPPLASRSIPAFRLRIGGDKRLAEFEPLTTGTDG